MNDDVLDIFSTCQCCLVSRAQQRCLLTPYVHQGRTELYSDMLKECFGIQLNVLNEKPGICLVCVGRLRDASNFKLHVERCQQVLWEQLGDRGIDGDVPALVNPEMASAEEKSDNLLHGEPAVAEADDGVRHGAAMSMAAPGARRERRYCCPVSACGDKFTKSSHLKRHEQIHTGNRPYTCGICKKTFIRASDLKKHERTHTGIRPYTCEICDRKFTESSNLKHHQRTHTGHKPYTCGICDKKFSFPGNLKRHGLTHEKEKPFRCDMCPKEFYLKYRLVAHVLTHKRKGHF